MRRLALIAALLWPAVAYPQFLDGLPPVGVLPAPPLSASDILTVCQGGTAGVPGTCTPRQAPASAFASVIPNISLSSPPPIGNVLPNTGAFSTLSTGTIKAPTIAGVAFANTGGGTAFQINSGGASAVANQVTIIPAGTGGGPFLSATGTDATILLKLAGKGGFAANNAGAVQVTNSPFAVVTGTQTVTTDVQQAFNVTTSITGLATNNPTGQYNNFAWVISPDNVQLPGVNQFLNGMQFSYNFGLGGGMTGNRNAFVVDLIQKGQTANTIASGTAGNYVGGLFRSTVSFNDNGTGVTPATAHGRLFGINPNATCLSGATNWYQCTGAEINVALNAGASALIRDWLSIAALSGSQQGSVVDAGIWFYGNGVAAQMKNALLIGGGAGINGWPIDPAGTIIATDANGGPATALNGIDFSPTTLTGFFLKGPASSFTVDGIGNVVAASYKAGASAGVSCAAGVIATSVSVIVTNGLVTAC